MHSVSHIAGIPAAINKQFQSTVAEPFADQQARAADLLDRASGARSIVQGAKDISAADPHFGQDLAAAMSGPAGPAMQPANEAPVNTRQFERGVNETLTGAGQAATLIGGPEAVLEHPIATAASLGLYQAGHARGEFAARKAGLNPDAQALAGTVGGAMFGTVGGMAGAKAEGALGDFVQDLEGQRAANAQAFRDRIRQEGAAQRAAHTLPGPEVNGPTLDEQLATVQNQAAENEALRDGAVRRGDQRMAAHYDAEAGRLRDIEAQLSGQIAEREAAEAVARASGARSVGTAQPVRGQITEGGAAASVPVPKSPPPAHGAARTEFTQPIVLPPEPRATPAGGPVASSGFTIGPDGRAQPTPAGELPASVDEYSIDTPMRAAGVRVVGRTADGQPIYRQAPGENLPVPVVGGVQQRQLPRGPIQLPASTAHPAGKVTGIDQATGLPIVDRSQPNDTKISNRSTVTVDEPSRQPPAAQALSGAHATQVGSIDPQSGREVLQPTGNLVQAQRLATAAAPDLKEELGLVADAVPGAEVDAVRETKDPGRAQAKAEKEGQPVETIPDLLAARISVDSPQAERGAVAAIKQEFPVVKEDSTFAQGDDYGFRSHTLQAQMPNGSTAEVQVVPKDLLATESETHPNYEADARRRSQATRRGPTRR